MLYNLPVTLDKPLAIVIPIYNEAESIVGLVEEIRACLDVQLDYEVIVVDEGSTDDGVDRLRDYRNSSQAQGRAVPPSDPPPPL